MDELTHKHVWCSESPFVSSCEDCGLERWHKAREVPHGWYIACYRNSPGSAIMHWNGDRVLVFQCRKEAYGDQPIEALERDGDAISFGDVRGCFPLGPVPLTVKVRWLDREPKV